MSRKKKRKKQHRFFWWMVKFQIVLMLLVLGGLGYYYFGGYAVEVQDLKKEAVKMVGTSNENTFIPSRTCSIYDTNGLLISETDGDKDAVYVNYEDIPPDFVSAMVSIEDKKYYRHAGVDYKAILRAVKAVIVKGKIEQGGSTITMQLAKLIYLDNSGTWEYKVEQIFIAIELEKRYSKNKIMEYYLNNVYFANGYYGVEAACKGYFNCELSELDLSQIAFLCAIPNGPTYYDPLVNYDHTITRRNLILQNLLDDGKIDQDTYNQAVEEEIVLNPAAKQTQIRNNYVDTYVYYCATRALMEKRGFQFQNYFDSDEEEKAYEEAYDEEYSACQKQIYSSGYRIYTSIDLTKQQALQEAMDNELASFTETGEDGMYSLQGSAVSIDNDTGLVVAIVGGRSQDFSSYTLNRAYQSFRQPGSSIKPVIVYTPAFENGYTPDSIVKDEEIENGPQNASKTYQGDVSIRYAVEQSLNTVAWKLYDELTPKVGLQYLKNMNFSKIQPEDDTPATSIGGFTIGMSSLEMASAYATIENDGIYRTPGCIKSILDQQDNVVYSLESKETVIYKQTAARMMTDVLQSVMTNGLGRNMQLDHMVSAGKTGTTNDNKDGWFCGYTRYYTTAVWVGYDIPKEVPGLGGGSYPGQIWKNYMNQIHEGLTSIDFLPYAQLSEEFQENQRKQQEEKQEQNQQSPENQPEVDNQQTPDNQPEADNQQGVENQPEDGNPQTPENPQGVDNQQTPDNQPEADNQQGVENQPEDGNPQELENP